MATKLDKDTTKPSTVEAGDAPADTTDPDERASTVLPDPGPEALAVGTVNSARPLPQRRAAARNEKPRTETYKATRPDGTEVTVSRNIETGESEVK